MSQVNTPINPFKKAERKRAWLKFGVTGPSGSGKTMSSLKLMRGIVGPQGRIALIDTENDSASLYADVTEFDSLNIDPPYTTEKYIAAIKAALDNKYDGLIIDTISHAWAGEGGLIDQKEAIDARGGRGETNKFTNWAMITKKHEQFKAWLLKADIHMIVTMRSKQDYVLGEGNKPQKVGMAPIQRDGMEYEFTTVFDIAMNHTAMTSKDRTNLFDQKIFTISEDTGKAIVAWHQGASAEAKREAGFEAPTPPRQPQTQARPQQTPPAQQGQVVPPGAKKWEPTEAQLTRLFTIAHSSGYDNTKAAEFMRTRYGVTSSKQLNRAQYDEMCDYMAKNPVQVATPTAPVEQPELAPPPIDRDFESFEPGDAFEEDVPQ